MGPHKKVFLLHGSIFAVVGLVLDAVRGKADHYWWVDVIGTYAAAALVALATHRLSKRRVNKEELCTTENTDTECPKPSDAFETEYGLARHTPERRGAR